MRASGEVFRYTENRGAAARALFHPSLPLTMKTPVLPSVLPPLLAALAVLPAAAQTPQIFRQSAGSADGGPPGALYQSFISRSASVNSTNDPAWLAQMSGGGVTTANDAALWRVASGNVGLVLREGEAVAGQPAGTVLGALNINDNAPPRAGAMMVLSWPLAGGGTTTANDTALFSNAGGTFGLIFREGEQAPGLPAGLLMGEAPFGNTSYAVHSSGRCLFPNTFTGAGVTTANDASLWTHLSGAPVLVVREGDPVPDGPAEALLATLSSMALLNAAGETAFAGLMTGGGVTAANDSGVWYGAPGSLALVVREGAQAPGMPAGVLVGSVNTTELGLGDPGQIALRGAVTGPGVNAGNDSGVWAGPHGSLRLLAREGAPVPETPPGVNFANLNGATGLRMAGRGFTAMAPLLGGSGVTTASDTALLCGTLAGLDLVAREGDQVPGEPAGVLFGQMPLSFALNSSGQTVFLNNLTGAGVSAANDTALFATDGLGRLHQLLRESEELPGDGRSATGNITLAYGGSTTDGRRTPLSDGGIVFMAVQFTNSTSALLRSDLSSAVVDPANGFAGSLTLADGLPRHVPRDIIVGEQSQGCALTVTGGSTVEAGNELIMAFHSSAAGGTLTVAGTGSSVACAGTLSAGLAGTAAIHLSDGATLSSQASFLGHCTVVVDNAVWHAGDVLDLDDAFTAGPAASLTMSNGAICNVFENMVIEDNTVTLDGAGTALHCGDSLLLAGSGASLLSASGGAEIHTAHLLHGLGAGDRSIQLSGAGTALFCTGSCALALNGPSTTRILDGALLESPVITAAALTGGNSTILVDGGTLRSSSDLILGGDPAGPSSGAAALTVSSGGVVECTRLTIHQSDTLTLNDGTLRLAGIVPGPGVIAWNAGTVDFGSSMAADSATLSRLLGAGHVLSGGKTLRAQTLTLLAPLVVDGGTLAVDHIVNPGLLTWRSGRVETTSLTVAPAGLLGGQVTVGAGQELAVAPPGAATVAAGSRLTLTGGLLVAETINNHGETRCGGAAILNGMVMNNTGVLLGDAFITAALTNAAAGQVRVRSGEEMVFTGTAAHGNAGTLDVVDGALEFFAPLTNSAGGMIFARDASLRFGGGLTNNGSLALSFGVTDLYGDIANQSGGQIVLSGGGFATFVDDVSNAGTLRVSAGAQAVFFGALSGNGVAGGGTVFAEGDLRPGFSPGLMNFGGDLTLGALNELTMEIGGLTAGSRYDQLNVTGTFTRDGTLTIALLNGFTPAAGDSFALFNAGSAGGTFAGIVLPPLPAGLYWRKSQLYSDGILSVGVVPDTFAEFSSSNNLTGGPGDDDDGDGLSNTLEYLLASDPSAPNLSQPASVLQGDTLTFSFDAPVPPGGDAIYIIETSPDLAAWTTAATRTGSAAWTGPGAAGVAVAPSGGGMEQITFTRTGSDARLFVRLRAALAP